MAKHKGRAGHFRLMAAALGVTALAAATSLWTAQANPADGKPQAGISSPAAEHHEEAEGDKVVKVAEDIAHASDRGEHGVNITIDDGPDPRWTPQVLELLKENKVKATFCMVGTQAEAYPNLVKAVVAGGHKLCNHTVSHDTAMDKKSEAYQSKEILDAERMITKASGGVRPQYYRAPGGAFTPYSRHLAASHGMRPLGWNVDSRDFERPGVDTMVATVKREIANGPTVLFHDAGGDRSQTLEALRQVLPWLREQGYEFGYPVR
ncbi:polysaccharide deacetylase family protein [Streptomyces sp. NPDC057682]|uniref:polysaccharide deacetylase family protein n=1 Tax=unclassified Streptomyces TaxID=2593676 RepID=UPI00366298CF